MIGRVKSGTGKCFEVAWKKITGEVYGS